MITNDTLLLEQAYENILLEEGVVDSIQTLGSQITNLPNFIEQSIGWLGKAALGGVAGAVVAKGLGKMLEIAASRMDRKRQKQGDFEQSAVAGVANAEFIKGRDKYEKQQNQDMPLEAQMKLRMDIASKLQEMYPVRDKTFWVKVLELASKGMQSNIGMGIGAVLGVLATKLAVPFPTL